MFIESAISKRFFLAPAERNIVWSPRINDGNVALRWSASYRVRSTIYKHFAPLERKLIPLLHLKVEFTKSHFGPTEPGLLIGCCCKHPAPTERNDRGGCMELFPCHLATLLRQQHTHGALPEVEY
jgi:hypothetical protein